MLAVVNRSSLSAVGIDTAERFGADAATLSMFAVVQLAVYGGMQIPVGLLLDRYGARPVMAIGMVLMASMALLPPMLSRIYGYPVMTTGMVMAPRGIGTMLSMVLVGRLVRVVDPRLLIATGLAFALVPAQNGARAQDTYDTALLTTAILVGLGLLIAAGAALALALGVSRPLQRMTEAMRRLATGDTAVAVPGAERGDEIGALADFAVTGAGGDDARLLAPCDLQAIKASGVTFAASMVERVIEEQAAGNPDLAAGIRERIGESIGANLRGIVPGSDRAAEVAGILKAEGLWSQYLEVGIGPDAEIFTKSQPMAAVGWGADVGLHPVSRWNNPEPEVVLAVDSRGRIKGATLGNDVNLRDVEGRSALLLGKAKDNNASAAIGPFIRLFDGGYGLEDVRRAELTLRVEGQDGFVLDGASSMSQISRDPVDLVAQMLGRHHQYPDGAMLFLGTLFAPTQDRDAPGLGFTHHDGDVVTIATPTLGRDFVVLTVAAPTVVERRGGGAGDSSGSRRRRSGPGAG